MQRIDLKGSAMKRLATATISVFGACGVLLSSGCATQQTPTPQVSAGSPVRSPSPTVVADASPLSPENLAKLKTTREITRAFEIRDGDFGSIEEFAQLYVKRDRYMEMAGTTYSEWESTCTPSDLSTKQDYIDAMVERYNQPMMDGIFSENAAHNRNMELRAAVLDRYATSLWLSHYSEGGKVLGAKTAYSINQKYLGVLSSSGSVKAGKFSVALRMESEDNLPDTKMDVYWTTLDRLDDTYKQQLTVVREHDGTWKIEFSNREEIGG